MIDQAAASSGKQKTIMQLSVDARERNPLFVMIYIVVPLIIDLLHPDHVKLLHTISICSNSS